MSSAERYEAIANAMRIDLPFLRAVGRRATGSEPRSETRIAKGESNAVFEVLLANGLQVIARQNFKGGQEFQNEAAVIAAVAAAGVPTAEPLGIESTEIDGGLCTVAVQTKLRGEPMLDMLKDSPARQVEHLMDKARQILALIHSVPTSELPVGATPSLDVLENWAADAARARQSGRLPENSLKTVNAALSELQDARFGRPTLIHGDFHPKHLMTDGETITGVIDFEVAELADPAMDYGDVWNFWRQYRGHEPQYPSLMYPGVFDAYGNDFGRRVRWAELRSGISTISWYLSEAEKGNSAARLQDAANAVVYLEMALERPVFTKETAARRLE